MPFVLDTCVWVDVERGAISAADVDQLVGGQQVFLSPVCVAELRMGADLAENVSLRRRRAAALARLDGKPTLAVDRATGLIFGALAAAIQRAGGQHRRRVQDLWLASQSLQYGCGLLTRNPGDFRDIPGLRLLAYRLQGEAR